MGRTRRFFLILVLLAFAIALALAGSFLMPPSHPPATPPRPSAHPQTAEAAGLLDRLERARIEQFPATNLPPEIDGLRGRSVAVASNPFDAEDWVARTRPGPSGPPRGYGLKIPETIRPDAYIRFVEHDTGPPSKIVSLPNISMDASRGVAISRDPEAPSRASIVYREELEKHVEAVERRHGEAPAEATELRSRTELQGVTRDALTLPAPGTLSFDLGPLDADAFNVAVGVRDFGWEPVQGILVPTQNASDGVTFRVEIEVEPPEPAQRRALWSRHVLPSDGFVRDAIDLSDYRGKKVRLHLVSDPGPEGNNHFDYAVWGDLRFERNLDEPQEMPHIVLVVIDTLRSDRLGIYGYPRPTTPHLDRWAQQRARIFEDTTATANWTMPSVASILTGLHVRDHSVGVENKQLLSEHRPLAQVLAEAGYETYGFCEGAWMAADFGFDEGFDLYDCSRFQDPAWDEALEIFRSRQKEAPVFLFLQTYMVHTPLEPDPRMLPSEDFGGRLAGTRITDAEVFNPVRVKQLSLTDEEQEYISHLYDAAVQRMDGELATFLEGLEAEAGDDDLLVVVTSDHGEEFFEHGTVGHGQSLYRELLQIPLMIRFPDGQRGTSAAPASAIDIAPTILDTAGISPQNPLPGISLHTPPPEDRVRIAEGTRTAVQQGHFKLIFADGSDGSANELYHLKDDPGETRNLYELRPRIVSKLRQAANAANAPPSTPPAAAPATVRDETRRRLRALGYTVD